ncbi:glycosyltransferase family 4 protein [Candidatus Saccharibacteria bacterium]|nr:MAG: glycosyltransferase family 4 protein [Candidatus Saccharibacteria bacterium]
MKKLKIAIVTDWITDMGGMTRVDLALHEAFPDAPIYTSVYEPDALARKHFDGLDIRTTWLQKLPKNLRKLQRLFPMLRVRAFRDLDLSEFDIILSSSSAESKQVRKTREGQVHICYCHTPIRYYWSHYQEYKKDPGLGKLNWLARLAMPVLVPSLKRADYQAAQAVDVFIANSSEVQKRIKKYYGKPSTVVHPPVDAERFAHVSRPITERSYYLAHGRQVPYKKIDLAVQACTALNLPLIVSGSGPEHENLKKIAGPAVEFRPGQSDEQVAELFGGAKAYIFPAEEDFGIVQVEALAAGTPVIAFAGGGSQDIVKDGEGGITFASQSSVSLQNALIEFEKREFKPTDLQRIAKRFHKTLFISKMRKIVSDQS